MMMLEQLKEQIKSSKARAAFKVNGELTMTYHYIGSQILSFEVERDKEKLIDQLSQDFKKIFPDMNGFSPTNLRYMRKFAQEYTDAAFVQEILSKLPWGFHQILLDKISERETRLQFISSAIKHAWSLETLKEKIKNGTFE